MVVIIAQVDMDWGKAFQGYLPSKYLFASGALYTCMLCRYHTHVLRLLYSCSCRHHGRDYHASQSVFGLSTRHAG